MKKFLSVIAAIVIFGGVSYAQSSPWGIRAGYLSSDLKVSQSGVSVALDFNGFYAGVTYDHFTNTPGLALSTGANLEYKKLDIVAGDVKTIYVNIPFHVKYFYPLGETAKIFFSAGPAVNVGVMGDVSINDDDYGFNDDSDDKAFGDDALKRLHVQMGASIGILFSDKYELHVGYDYGLSKGMDIGVSNRINTIRIGLGLRF